MKNLMLQLLKEEEGASMVEYVLLVALIAVVAAVGFGTLGKRVNQTAVDAGTDLSPAP